MARLEILHFPDPRLRIQAQPVQQINNTIKKIVHDLFETMYAAPGIGLAATQVNIHQQIIVIDATPKKNHPLCFINPLLVDSEGVQCIEEGCLSVPDIYEPVDRARQVTVQALDAQGQVFTLTAENVLAVCIQHEMDHLQGKLFVDHLSLLKQQRIRKKLLKQQRQTQPLTV